MQINKLKFIGGPRDGDELTNKLPVVPGVIDRNSIHIFGPDAYALIEINWDEGYATFEHMTLIDDEKPAMDYS